MAAGVRRSLAFLVGFGFSLLPNLAPFLAILAAFSQEWRLRRSDAYWLTGLALLTTPFLVAGSWAPAASGAAEMLAAWLLYRSFDTLRGPASLRFDGRIVGIGMLVGLATVIVAASSQVERIQPLAHLFQAVVWENPPNLFAHTVLVLGLLIAVFFPKTPYRTTALVLSALGILLAGSRDAAIAWTVGTLLVLLAAPTRRAASRFVEVTILVGMVVLAAGITSTFGFARLGFLLAPSDNGPNHNLLHGTEMPHGDWWFRQGVGVKTGSLDLTGEAVTTYIVTKQAAEPWRRFQQGVDIAPGGRYTLSAWIRSPSGPEVPGLEGWGENRTSNDTLVLVSSLENGTWRAHLTGSGSILGTGSTAGPPGWVRTWVSFRYAGSQPLHWWVGFSPDERDAAGTSGEVAAMQLEAGSTVTDYLPGTASAGLSLASSRLPYWSAAWSAFLQRPLLGHPDLPFSQYYAAAGTPLTHFYEIPAHAHNLMLQVAYRQGLVGLIGLALILYALARSALRRRDVLFMVVLGTVLLANVFDYTLFFGGVFYPLAAAAGWRSAVDQPSRRTADQRAHAALVRFFLATFDLVSAGTALGLAFLVRAGLTGSFGLRPVIGGLPHGVMFALVLWPILSWREGLYPGYGMTAPQELRRGVIASAQAGLLLAAGTVIFVHSLPVPRSVLLLTVMFALFTAPLGRAVAKRVLAHLGAWGRDVVILGAGETGERVGRSLRRAHLAGLNPVAFFDDDPAKRGTKIATIPVRGRLQDAGAFARRLGISHAIVAMPRLTPDMLAAIIQQSTSTFRRVQFVPELPGIPTEDVFTSELDDMLALEIRGGLYSPANRLAKRLIDIVGGTVLTLIAAPVLLATYIWIRLDSRGPGFHRSERLGEDGIEFRCFKFRTMHVDAEARLSQLLASDPALAAEYAAFHKLDNDPRVTRAGEFLRKFSLDELPQVLNVVLGQMSLVGPRPYLARELHDIGAFGEILFRAKPGITGFWQVSARNEVTFAERLRMESHYVRNWSIWWDIILLVQTPAVVLDGRGAK